MSTLEKTINLLESLPDNKIETVYAFVRFIDSDNYKPPSKTEQEKINEVQSALGIAHEYANPVLICQEEGAFERAMEEKNMQLIDTNVILRFVLNDNPEMAKQAAEVMISGAYTKPEVIAEVVYVLKSVYSAPKDKIKSIIHKLAGIIHIENSGCVIYAIDLYASVSLDFVDCLLIAYHKINHENIFSFDKKLNKHLEYMNEKRKLSQEEADRLIAMLKTTLCNEIYFPSKNSGTEFDVQGDTKQDIFTIKIFRSKIKHNKYTFGARIKKDGILLLELHINPGSPHSNPDGTKIIGSHWHIYQEGYDRKFAFPAADIDDDDFISNTLLFFDKFHLISKPDVNYQMELLS